MALTVGMVSPIHVYAQVPGATLSGTVSDESGAAIPNAQVSIKNVATGEVRASAADTVGFYAAPNLLPGRYDITVAAPGFSTQVRSGITLTVGAQQVLNISMKVGETTQTVVVTGEAPGVQLATATLGAVVNSATVLELPLNGRDWTQLATLQPGVNSTASIQADVSSGFQRGNRGFGAQLTISGARPQQNSYFIDGINANDVLGGSPGSVGGGATGVDAIQEFSVLTSNYSAEYGRTSGGVINAVTRSGTNQFHGDAYDFLRNSALDARNYFDGATILPFKRNQFGGSLGGPIVKDHTFVFVDYEGLRQSTGVTTVDIVPSLDARNGVIHNVDGTTTTVTVDPLVKPFLALWAPPNGALLSPGNTGIFTFAGNQVLPENFVTARVDNEFSEKDHLFGTYQFDRASFSSPDSLNDVSDGDKTGREFVALGESHVFTPQVLNSFRVGYNRNTGISDIQTSAINHLAADPSLGAVPGSDAPIIIVPGLTQFQGGLKAAATANLHWNSVQVSENVFLTKGVHSLKFGVDVERIAENGFDVVAAAGSFTFGSLTQFLTNAPTSFFAALPGVSRPRDIRQTVFGSYFEDDVRLRSNLTVNLGLRYEMSTVPTEVDGELVSLHNLTDAAPHLGNPFFSNPTLRNFEPRVGFAWDPFRDSKTSVRGGFGMFDVLPLPFEFIFPQFSAAPFYLQGSANNLAPGTFPTRAFSIIAAATTNLRTAYVDPNPKRNYVMQWNLNIQRELVPNLTLSGAYVGSRGIHQPFRANDVNIVLPTLTPSGYLWPFPAGTGTVLNPNVGRIDTLTWTSSSFYDALEVQMIKSMSHGFQVEGAYTWGKSIDEGSSSTLGDAFLNSISSLFFFNPKLRRGLSDFNVAHNLTINNVWNVPAPNSLSGPATWAASGWQLNGIVQIRSGLPFTPLIGGDPLGLNSTDAYAYPNRLKGSGCQTAVNPGNVNDYIKLNCFTLPTAPAALAAQCTPFPSALGTCSNLLGNSARNSVIGPGLVNVDFSLFKNNYIKRISESFNVQFRAEFFNVFNHSNFNSPIDNSTLFDQTGAPVPGAGLIDSTSTTAREIQFALKLIF
jgi:hypothetical protein